MLYILKAAIALALLYSCFFFFLSKETFHRFNRIMLVSIMLSSLIIPLFHFTVEHPTRLHQEVFELQEIIVTATAPKEFQQQAEAKETVAEPLTWITIVTYIYWAGVGVMLIITLIQVISLTRYLRGGLRHTDSQGNTVILQKGEVSPFSIFRHIVMSVKDYENNRQYILTHEQEHIRQGHTYDLLLLEAVKTLQWFNPFIWFLSQDLKSVHEYEADQAVIHKGIDAKSYQQLLVIKVVGNRLQPFANNLNHGSLKKRIIMMYQKPSNRWLMLKALCAIPVVALTLNAFATPNNSVEKMVSHLDTQTVNANKTSNMVKSTISTSEPKNETSNVKQIDEPFTIHPVTDQYGRITGFTHEGTPPENMKRFVFDHQHVIIKGHQAKEEELKNYQEWKTWKNVMYEIKSDATNEPILIVWQSADEEASALLPNTDEDAVFDVAEKIAEYEGGAGALMQLFAQNLKYPVKAAEQGMQGRVFIQFIINKDGCVSDAHSIRGIDIKPYITPEEYSEVTVMTKENKEAGKPILTQAEAEAIAKQMEEESIRVIYLTSGKWKPAEQNGQKVRMRYTVPITFRLQ